MPIKTQRAHKRSFFSSLKQLPLSTIASLVFCLGVLWAYQSIRIGQQERQSKIYASLSKLENQKSALQQNKERMHEEIASQNDPAFVEMVLIKKLGFVPKGSSKVLFVGRSSP